MMTDQTNPRALSPNAFARRRMIAASAIGIFSPAIAAAQAAATGSAKDKAVIITRAIHQEEDFKAQPKRIYEALLDSKQFTAFSGGRSAEIQPEAGGVFSLFAGHIVGRNLELAPNRRIVQAWRVVPWPEGIYSIARFELAERGSGTRIIFDHTGFPSELADHLATGWTENYWTALRKYLS
jgi:activator of HSP90 ATPase